MRILSAVAFLASVAAVQALHYPLHESIAQVNSMNVPWVAGVNQRWVGKSVEDIKVQLGTILPTPSDRRLPAKIHMILDEEAIPSSFDARDQWPDCESIQEIRDQSNCGSCWAFGAVEAATDRICIATNNTVNLHISAQHLTSCCSSCGFGCNGGYPSSAWSYLKSQGLVTGGNYGDYSWCSSYSLAQCEHHTTGKYPACTGELPTPKCPTKCDAKSTYKTPFNQDKHKFKSSYSIASNVAQIQTEIMNHGPVEGAFTVYDDFPNYKSGVYVRTSSTSLGGHAIKILGWGTQSGVNYWLVANSWNNDWGDNGFFKIRRGTDECGIEDEIVAGLFA